MKKCRFCFPLDKKNQSLVLGQLENFYLLSSIGPIIEGHLLICSKKHYSSSADLPVKLLPEFIKLKNKVKEVFEKNYGGYTFFEHGKTKSCQIKEDDAHCLHAHLHGLPTSKDALPFLVKELGQPIEIDSPREIKKILQDSPYLFYETKMGQFLWKAPKDLRKQFFRFVLVEKVKISESRDWKIDPNWQGARNTYQRLSAFFKILPHQDG